MKNYLKNHITQSNFNATGIPDIADKEHNTADKDKLENKNQDNDESGIKFFFQKYKWLHLF